MDYFDHFNKRISQILFLLFLLSLLIFFTSCGSKISMYNIYLEHQPSEPLYTTSCLKDAQEYYNKFQPYHSDMFIRVTEEDNNLVILK